LSNAVLTKLIVLIIFPQHLLFLEKFAKDYMLV